MELMDTIRARVRLAYGRMPFSERMETSARPAVVWEQFVLALTDSRASKLWPNELESVRSDGVEPHAVIEATYRTLFGKRVFHYKIVDLKPGRSVTYAPLKDHVFVGAATIELRPTETGTAIEWAGEYRFEPTQSVAAFAFRVFFKPLFYARFKRNLKALEAIIA